MTIDTSIEPLRAAGNTNPLFNQSLEKGLAVLRSFNTSHRSMTIGEVGKATGMNRSSAQRLVYTLEQLGYLRKHSKTGRYQLTVRSLEIGFNYLSTHTLIDIANPFLSELSNFSGETVCLTEPDRLDMVYIARFVSSQHIPVHMPIGSRIPMYCSASGRAILSTMPEDKAFALLRASTLEKHTANTCTDIDQLMGSLQTTRQRGYAVNQEELFLGDMALASPIINSANEPVASVHIVVPTSRWTMHEAQQKLVPSLLACTRALNNSMRAI